MMLTVKEVCERLKLSQAAVYRLIASGDLECHRFGRAIRVSDTQLRALLEQTLTETESSSISQVGLKHL